MSRQRPGRFRHDLPSPGIYATCHDGDRGPQLMSVVRPSTELLSSPITRVETVITTNQLPRTLRVAHGTVLSQREHVIVRLTNADGVCGYGEASPLTFFTGETAETTQFAVEHFLGPMILGRLPQEIAALHRL